MGRLSCSQRSQREQRKTHETDVRTHLREPCYKRASEFENGFKKPERPRDTKYSYAGGGIRELGRLRESALKVLPDGCVAYGESPINESLLQVIVEFCQPCWSVCQ